jgi:hypothetical protein
MHKKVFQVTTTSHPNAAPYQAGEAKEWLNNVLTQIARQTSPSGSGEMVTVIIEVLQS